MWLIFFQVSCFILNTSQVQSITLLNKSINELTDVYNTAMYFLTCEILNNIKYIIGEVQIIFVCQQAQFISQHA
jgi:hypothetical protein